MDPSSEEKRVARTGLRLWLPTLGSLLSASGKAWLTHRAPSKGAALAFYMLFSMAPILVLVMAIAGHFFGSLAIQGEIFAQLHGLLGPTGALAVQALLADAHLPGSGHMASWMALVLLGMGATSVFAELKDSLDDLWNVEPGVNSGLLALIRARILSFSLILVLAFLLLITMVVNAVLALAMRFWSNHWPLVLPLVSGLSQVLTFTVITFLFAVISKVLPEAKLSWRDVAIGSATTAALFTLGKHLIGAYLGTSALGSSYGAAGALVAVLVWVYYSAQIFFLGAALTREFALTHGSLRSLSPRHVPEPPSAPLRNLAE